MERLLTNRYKELTNYALVFFLIGVSGFPFFIESSTNVFILFLFSLFFYLKRSIRFDARGLEIILIFFLVEVAQIIFIKPFTPITMLGSYVRLFSAFFVVSLCGKKFTQYYSDIIYWLSIIGFAFFIPSVISASFFNFFQQSVCSHFPPLFGRSSASDFYLYVPNIIIYSFHPVLQSDFRNSGPFWEPGAYVIFIIIAIIFNVMRTNKIWYKKNIILSLAVVSTFSTTGYIAFFLLIISYYFIVGNMIRNMIILSLVIPVVVTLYFNLDFMSKKIENNIALNDNTTSRAGSALADWKDFIKSPVLGWGKGEMRYGGKHYSFFTEDQHRNNGFTDFLVTYGIIVMFTLLYNYYKTFKILCKINSFDWRFATATFLIVIIMSMGESIFQYAFFYSIMFIHLVYTKNNSRYYTSVDHLQDNVSLD